LSYDEEKEKFEKKKYFHPPFCRDSILNHRQKYRNYIRIRIKRLQGLLKLAFNLSLQRTSIKKVSQKIFLQFIKLAKSL